MSESKLDNSVKSNTSQNGLEGIVNLGASALAFGLGLASPLLYSDPGMRLNAFTTGPPLALGSMIEDKKNGKPVDYVKAGKESLLGTIMTPALSWVFRYIEVTKQYVTDAVGAVGGGAAAVASLAVAQGVFVPFYMSLNHVIQNFSFKGLYDKLKSEYLPTMKRVWTYVLPFSSLNVLFLSGFGIPVQLAYSSLTTLLFRLVGPKSNGANNKKDVNAHEDKQGEKTEAKPAYAPAPA